MPHSTSKRSLAHVAVWCCLVIILAAAVQQRSAPPEAEQQYQFVRFDAETPLERLLDKQIDVDVTDTPIRTAIEQLAAEQGITVRFDDAAFENRDLFSNPVSMHLKQISLRNALQLLLDQCNPTIAGWDDATYVEQPDELLITSVDAASEMLETRFYPLPDITYTPPLLPNQLWTFDIDSMIEFIESLAAPDSWEAMGGLATIRESEGGMLISQTQAAHREIRDLYGQIDRFQSRPYGSDYPAQPGQTYSNTEQEIFMWLTQSADLDFVDAPLSEVLHTIGENQRINVWIDERSLDDEGIRSDEPSTVHVTGISLGAALKMVLAPQRLTFVVDNDVLEITTQIAAEENIRGRMYDLRRVSLVGDYDTVCELIAIVVAPETWEFSGPCPVINLPGVIGFPQTEDVHHEIAQLLLDIERIRTTPRLQRPAAAPLNRDRRAKQRIDQILARPVSLKYENRPLTDVMNAIARECQIPLWIDQWALSDENVSPVMHISADIENVSLKDALETLLKPQKLAAVYNHEMLYITTDIVANEILTPRVYDAVDLLDIYAPGWVAQRERQLQTLQKIMLRRKRLMRQQLPGQGFFQIAPEGWYAMGDEETAALAPTSADKYLEHLVNDIETNIAPKSWDSVGGPGTIMEFEDALVVRQTEAVHEQIADWLKKLRQKK